MRKPLICSLLVLSAGCSKNAAIVSSAPQTSDQSAEFFPKLAATRLVSQGSSLTFGADGSFELIRSTDVAHWLRRAKESDASVGPTIADCVIRISGKSSYFDPLITAQGNGFSVQNKLLQLQVTGAEVISSSDKVSVAETPGQTCQSYAAALVDHKTFSLDVEESAADHLRIKYFGDALDIPGDPGDKLANKNSSVLFKDGYGPNLGITSTWELFQKAGTRQDLSAWALGEITGSFKGRTTWGEQLQLKLSAPLKELIIKSPACGRTFILDLDQVYSEEGYFKLHGKLVKTTTFTPDTSLDAANSASSCANVKDVVSAIQTSSVGFTYSTGVCRDSACADLGVDLRIGKLSAPADELTPAKWDGAYLDFQSNVK